jgi:hypothetical protein
MFEAVIWTLQTKHEYNLPPFLSIATKKSATLCLPFKHASGAAVQFESLR